MKDVIKRQGSKSFTLNIFSILLGVLNNLFIYPMYLGFYGTFQMVWNFVRLMTPFSMFGLPAVINKYFVEYKGRGKDFHFFILKWFLISFSVFTAAYVFILPLFVDSLEPFFPFIKIVSNNMLPLYLALLFYCLNTIMINVSYTYKRIVVPVLFSKIIKVKVLVPLFIILASFLNFETAKLLWSFVFAFALVFFLFVLYAIFNKWTINASERPSEISSMEDKLKFGAFGSFNELGMYLAFSIDFLLVFFLLGDTATGFYAIFLFLASIVRLPTDSLSGLFLPLVSSFFKDKDYKKIGDYYKRLSKAFLYLSSGIFLAIYFSLEDILHIMGKENLVNAKYIFVFISIGIIVNALTYMNSAIIIQSEYYKWNLAFVILLAILNVFISYYLIVHVFPTSYASAGAACGTAISLSVFNLLKTCFVYLKFKMWPFSKSTIIILAFSVMAFILLSFIDINLFSIINICIYSLLVGILYFVPIYFLGIVKDINDLVNNLTSRLLANKLFKS